MNSDEPRQQGLVPSSSALPARVGARSLTARGRDDLRRREEAQEWLRRGMELSESAPSIPGRGPHNPYAEPVPPEQLIRTITPTYIEQVSAGVSPDLAAQRLGMTQESQELAHVIHHFMPEAFAEVWREEANRKAEILQRRDDLLKQAFLCFQKGHQLDPLNPELMYRLAESTRCGHGCEKKEPRSVELFRQAAEMGHARAQTALGDAYAQCGFGCLPKDEQQAAKWYEAAARNGDEDAVCMIVDYYQRGIGVSLNHDEAARILREAAVKGDQTALHNLSVWAKRFGPPYSDAAGSRT